MSKNKNNKGVTVFIDGEQVNGNDSVAVNAFEGMNETASGKQGKKKKGGKAVLIIFLVILFLLVAVVAAFFVMREIGRHELKPNVIDVSQIKVNENAVVADEGKTIKYNGKTYVYNDDIVPIALLGIDTLEMSSTEKSAQSDLNMVAAINTSTGEVSFIVIPRDTKVDIDIIEEDGTRRDIYAQQICLAHSYGDGKQTSCENSVRAIQRVLCGLPISSYISLDLKGIEALNDAVGGITLTSLETIHDDFAEGQEYTLDGYQARRYVQERDTTKFNSDSLRRERQLQYTKAFMSKAYESAKQDFGVVTDLYSTAEQYIYSDLTANGMIYLASVVLEKRNFDIENIKVVEGEAVMEGNYMVIRNYEESAFQIALETFYTEQ